MFTVIAIADLGHTSYGSYESRAEAVSVMDNIDDSQLPERCIDIVVHPGSVETFMRRDYV